MDLQRDATGEAVRILHDALTALGVKVAAAERKASKFSNSTAEGVCQLQSELGLAVTGIVDATTGHAIEEALANAKQRYRVDGRVASQQRVVAGGLTIRVVDKGPGADRILTETSTDAQGRYVAYFTGEEVRKAGKAAPDLQARAYSGRNLLGASDVRYNAGAAVTLNIQLPAAADRHLPAEHETLTAALATHYKGKLRDLKEAGDRSDVTYLANKTGWDARAVALAALADEFGARTDGRVPPGYFYALFRAGLPANEDVLYRADPGQLESLWKRAQSEGLIADDKSLAAATSHFRDEAASRLLNAPSLPGTSAFKEIFAAAGLSASQQKNVADLYVAHSNDLDRFWTETRKALGARGTATLQTHGKLAYLTLNNASLMTKLAEIGDPAALAAAGYHDARKWQKLITPAKVPEQIPGRDANERAANYAEYLAAQIRFSYPTASVAEMVRSGTLKVGSPNEVAAFLDGNKSEFELGLQPVAQFVADKAPNTKREIAGEVQRLQRVLQLTPSDEAMPALLDNGYDAAYHIVRKERAEFVAEMEGRIGRAAAEKVHARATQIHGAVLNVAIGYLTTQQALPLGAMQLRSDAGDAAFGQLLAPQVTRDRQTLTAGITAYATLEELFGSMDYCACDHCRSILSPAAYMVDLLQFIDRSADGLRNAQEVLFERRPDIQHLPLTCENTHTALPYIDIVNETLEFFITNGPAPLSLTAYVGHDTGASTSEELLATPQFVNDNAYGILKGEVPGKDAWFPSPLPFNREIETQRRYFDIFDTPLAAVMERLGTVDALDAVAPAYGWRDIFMEQLGLSREEHRVLTDGTLTLAQLFGYTGMSNAQVIAALSNAKAFSRRIGIDYETLIRLLETRFVNPNSPLIAKLMLLNVSFAAIKAVNDGSLSGTDFLKLLPKGAAAPDAAAFEGNILTWVTNPLNLAGLMAIITLANPADAAEVCPFEELELRYSKPVTGPGDLSTRLKAADFVRLLRFIRLWRKTGWTIEQTDEALCALFRADLAVPDAGDTDTVAKLDTGFKVALPRLAVAVRALDALGLTVNKGLLPLLACWAPIGTHGATSLYRTMFITPSMRDRDPAFADTGKGAFLTDATAMLLDHAEALRGAFNLSGPELAQIAKTLNYGPATPLSVAAISAIYRRGWLARVLKISASELLMLARWTGIDPFAAPDIGAAPDVLPPVLRLIDLVQRMKDRSLKSAAALYLIWNQDLSGQSAPQAAQVDDFARSLRADFAAIDDQFKPVEDPDGDILRARLTLVYGQDSADAFLALIDGTIVLDVPYTHATATLEPAIAAAAAALAYDDFSHRLSYKGLMVASVQGTLTGLPGMTPQFNDAVDALAAASADAVASFVSRYPELKPLYDAYMGSAAPAEQKRARLLADFAPELARRRKVEQALTRLSGATGLDVESVRALASPNGPLPLHAAGAPARPVLDDVLAVETRGLTARFYHRDTATAPVDGHASAVGAIDYPAAQPLPAHPTPGAAISAAWSGWVEIPESGNFNFVVTADKAATITLTLDGVAQTLVRNGKVARNANALSFAAGQLVAIELKVEKVKTEVTLAWEAPQRKREAIPGRYLYPPAILPPFRDAYVRLMKLAALGSTLRLTATELAHFGNDPDYRVAPVNEPWFNLLATTADPADAVATALTARLDALLRFSAVKAEWSPEDERVLEVLRNPVAATADEGLLFKLSRWDPASLTAIRTRFGKAPADLAQFATFDRIYRAFAPVTATGVSGQQLIAATTNAPSATAVRDFQAALKARYAPADWRDIIKPVNDELRELQRDALVAYILQQFRDSASPGIQAIDTPDKLYEFFLLDVEMASCAETSRIRLALSSIQLFIERFLMNLEGEVSPATIDAEQWKWRKRYRVWEANRKVFLFPENWLEPELRDQKSPFFKEIESELLESDITDDAAGQAVLGYLAKLHDVAHLVPAGMCIEEKDPGESDDIVHVVAQSDTGSRHYYYRRYEYGYWTAWEEIKLAIEGNPVLPVVWNNRLLLFWLKILKQTPQSTASAGTDTGPTATTKIGDMNMTQVRTSVKASGDRDVKVTLQAVLCWSEYYNGKWQPEHSSEITAPLGLGAVTPEQAAALDRTGMRLWSDEPGEGLRITVDLSSSRAGFRLFNTHAQPEAIDPAPISGSGRRRAFSKDGDAFYIYYSDYPVAGTFVRNPLSDTAQIRVVQAGHRVADAWTSPFFFEDNRNVFYVNSERRPVWVADFTGIGLVAAPPRYVLEIPPIEMIPIPVRVPPEWLGDPVDRAVSNPNPIREFIGADFNITQGIAMTGTVSLGDVQIGPAGNVAARQQF